MFLRPSRRISGLVEFALEEFTLVGCGRNISRLRSGPRSRRISGFRELVMDETDPSAEDRDSAELIDVDEADEVATETLELLDDELA